MFFLLFKHKQNIGIALKIADSSPLFSCPFLGFISSFANPQCSFQALILLNQDSCSCQPSSPSRHYYILTRVHLFFMLALKGFTSYNRILPIQCFMHFFFQTMLLRFFPRPSFIMFSPLSLLIQIVISLNLPCIYVTNPAP